MNFETPFTPDHSDRLTVLQLNSDSSKLLTASIDHKVAVYDVDRLTGKRKQIESFTAHDAEIRDARWFHPSTGTHFVTIGNDLSMRIWSQDTSQAPMSGRRFKKVTTIKSEQLIPFVSVDVKTVGNNTYIAVIDRQGLLSLYEPSNPDEYHAWSLVDQLYVYSPAPGRGDHTSFRARFDPNPFPLPYLTSYSDDQGQVSIAVSAMNEAKLYRSIADPEIIASHASTPSAPNIGRGASHRLLLFEVLRLQPSPPSSPPQSLPSGTLVRDIAFAPGNIRGTDMIAASSINGTVAIYEVSLRSKDSSSSSSNSVTRPMRPNSTRPAAQNQQSNLTSALHPTASTSTVSAQAVSRATHPFPYNHRATPISVLLNAHVDAWTVKWDASGHVLLSSGSDGTVKMWKRMVEGVDLGGFELIAEQAGDDDNDDEEDDGSSEDDSGDQDDEK